MNNGNINNEELLFNLPDYVAGKITDENLLLRIQSELNSNPEFKAEYDLLSETYSAVKDMKFSEPPEHYFTNLVPEINEKIIKQKESKGIAGFFRLSNLVKYALPAVSVVLLIVIITFTNKNSNDGSMFTQYSVTKSDLMKLDSEASNESDINDSDADSESDDEEEIADSDDASDLPGFENGNIIELYEENSDSEDEYFYYSDFETLTQIEQNELINTLTETKF